MTVSPMASPRRIHKPDVLILLRQVVRRSPPVGSPLPDIPDHVVQPESVLRPERVDRGGGVEAVRRGVLCLKAAQSEVIRAI